MTSWWRERQRKKREAETLDETLARVRRANIVIDLGVGPLLVPVVNPLSREETRKAIERMIQVAQTGKWEDDDICNPPKTGCGGMCSGCE